jgi:hypothetical protein
METGLLVVAGIVGFAVTMRLLAGWLDGERIDAYVRRRGGKVRYRSWTPFGRGWFGERNDRIYRLEYEDGDGRLRQATVKTSMFSGVYLTDDRVVQPRAGDRNEPAPDALATEDAMAALRAENERLRTELARHHKSE